MCNEKREHICIDRVVPFDLEEEARTVAIAENPENAARPGTHSSERMALDHRKMWRNGRTLRVRFLDGTPFLRAKVEQYAAEWTRHANLEFQFGDDPEAEIRVSFRAGRGSWSMLGTDALVRSFAAPDQPTMNFGWFDESTSEDEFSRVIVHEFGHAIGCIHEHQSPLGGIQWDEAAVLAYFSGPPNYWDEAHIRFNVLDKYSETAINGTEFDPDSIMLYQFPASLMRNSAGTHMNNRLSASDIAFIRKMYPGRPLAAVTGSAS